MNRSFALLVVLALAAAVSGGCHEIEDGYGYHHYVSADQHYDYPAWVEHDYYRPRHMTDEFAHYYYR